MTWQATILTLFPAMFPGPLGASLPGKALEDGKWTLETLDIRGFARDKHATVDDAPFGGGAGMVMRPDVIHDALQAGRAANPDAEVIYLSPRGRPFDQARAQKLAAGPGVVMLCGRYEGVDQRVLDAHDVAEISLGDFVLSGGEPAALTVLDACIRLLPGVVGSADSLTEESFESGLLEYPHYTRPQDWQGREVPEVLLSGHHERIREWRLEQSKAVTRHRRPDLWSRYTAQSHIGAAGSAGS
ncbi:MAG: tRNA (guanosine(37)-N1)-methyltransferase TrmD [Magnetospiraceae bacterium]